VISLQNKRVENNENVYYIISQERRCRAGTGRVPRKFADAGERAGDLPGASGKNK